MLEGKLKKQFLKVALQHRELILPLASLTEKCGTLPLCSCLTQLLQLILPVSLVKLSFCFMSLSKAKLLGSVRKWFRKADSSFPHTVCIYTEWNDSIQRENPVSQMGTDSLRIAIKIASSYNGGQVIFAELLPLRIQN